MKKLYIVLPFLLLTACAQMGADEDYYQEETLFDENADSVVVADDQSFRTEDTVQQDVSQPQQQPQQQVQKPVQPTQGPRISADGTVIELPAEQIYIGDAFVSDSVPAGYPAGKAGAQPIAYSEPGSGAQFTRPTQPAIVTLQNIAYPNTYAQCEATNPECVVAYEKQGYRQVNGLPRFAGYQDVLSASDYPENGRWRNGNNIPRW